MKLQYLYGLVMMVLVQQVGVVLPVWLGDDGSGEAGGDEATCMAW